MSESGRYTIIDEATGRKFVVEPLSGRGQKTTDRAFSNGGISGDGVKNKPSTGGSIREDESIITEDNGYKDVVTIGPYMGPEAFIDEVCKKGLKLTDLPRTTNIKSPVS